MRSLKLFFYLSPLLSIGHLSQLFDEFTVTKVTFLALTQGSRLHQRTPRNLVGGNPKGSAVKKNGRRGTSSSGSSKGNPEVGFANDS